jgi:hypothetical protein
MSPSAARTWLARARKDSRSLEREIARQEQAAKAVPPRLEDIISHTHSHGSGSDATGVHSTHEHTHVARSTRPPSCRGAGEGLKRRQLQSINPTERTS